jgi:hypothetical protein
MALNDLGGEKKQRFRAPIGLARLNLPDFDVEKEVKEASARVVEQRTIRAGVDAWESVTKSESFEAWKKIGAALVIGKTHALKASGARQAWGKTYGTAFSQWIKRHRFERMPPPTRSVAIELHENISAIEKWRATLPERQRRQLIHPLSVTRRWRAATLHGGGKCPQDLKRDAVAAWRRFVNCVSAMPPQMAAPFWRDVQAKAAAFLDS